MKKLFTLLLLLSFSGGLYAQQVPTPSGADHCSDELDKTGVVEAPNPDSVDAAEADQE